MNKYNCLHNHWMRRIKKLHFVGIGGAGMSGIAEIFLNEGYTISGSDISENQSTKHLEKLGATITYKHSAENIDNAEVVITSSAIKENNPEVLAAKNKHLPIVPRAEMLAELMRFRCGIAVAGTHGKTITTSLVTSLLAKGGLDPTFVSGGRLNSAATNARLGAGRYLVAEADESDASFLYLQPMVAIVTNIDEDHMGTYNGSVQQLRQTFIEFLHHLPFYGLAILCLDDPGIQTIIDHVTRPVKTYGFSEAADIRAVEVKQSGLQNHFIVKRGEAYPDLAITLNLPGRHNVLNALAAIALATELKISDAIIQVALAEFSGVARRFQIHGELTFARGKAILIEDYGHHPREINATLEAARAAWPSRRIVMVYQPHRHSRTRDLFADFTQTLSEADVLLMFDIYSAGEEPIVGVNSSALCQSISKFGKIAPIFVENHSKLNTILANLLQDEDILLLQGAGNIGAIAIKLAETLKL